MSKRHEAMNFSLGELLEKVYSGRRLSQGELTYVSTALAAVDLSTGRENLSADDIYLLLAALAVETTWLDEKLFEKFFDLQDPTTSVLIARTLCRSAEGRQNQLEKLLSLAMGSGWDTDEDVQKEAIELLGQYIRDENRGLPWSDRANRVGSCLIELFQDEKSSHDIRQCSYVALLWAYGTSEEQLPSRYATLDLSPGSKQIHWEIIEKIIAQTRPSP